jgi:hypothetical protein
MVRLVRRIAEPVVQPLDLTIKPIDLSVETGDPVVKSSEGFGVEILPHRGQLEVLLHDRAGAVDRLTTSPQVGRPVDRERDVPLVGPDLDGRKFLSLARSAYENRPDTADVHDATS